MLLSSNTVHDHTTTKFSLEIISEIIGYLHDDKKTLLTLGLVSKQTLYESRHHLFSAVDFLGSDSCVWEDFNRFLGLADAAWTSFTPTIHCISIQKAYVRCADDNTARRDIPLARIRANLSNVKSLRFLSVEWKCVPPYILDLVFKLPIEHLSLHGTYGCDVTALHNIFRRFPHSLRTLDFERMRFTKIPDLSKGSSTFHHPFQFESLDSQSLLLFKSVWDPSICHNLDIRVKSFYLQPQPLYDRFWFYQRDAPFISRFLQHIGPSLENITIFLVDHSPQDEPGPGISSLLDPLHVSRCINLRSLKIGQIKLEDQVPDSANMTDVVQKFLSALPSPTDLREISITVKPVASSLEDHLTMLKLFKWSSFVETVQRLFPNLLKLAIRIGIRERQDFNPFFDLLRQVSRVKELEEKGVINIGVFYSPRRVSPRPRCGHAQRNRLV